MLTIRNEAIADVQYQKPHSRVIKNPGIKILPKNDAGTEQPLLSGSIGDESVVSVSIPPLSIDYLRSQILEGHLIHLQNLPDWKNVIAAHYDGLDIINDFVPNEVMMQSYSMHIQAHKKNIEPLTTDYWTPTQIAQRIVEYSIAGYTPDEDRTDYYTTLVSHVDQIYQDITSIFGTLTPESDQTRQLILQKLADWRDGNFKSAHYQPLNFSV